MATRRAVTFSHPARPSKAVFSNHFIPNVLNLLAEQPKSTPPPPPLIKASSIPKRRTLSLLGACLQAKGEAAVQDVYVAAILSEIVYKAQDHGEEAAERAARTLEGMVPLAQTLGLQSLSWSPPGARQRYVMAEAGDALYCAFLGTKSPADLLTSFHVAGMAAFEGHPEVRVHAGYHRRAASVPAEQLYQLAVSRGKRLVLAGHSMGGAVASLCALSLLAKLPPALQQGDSVQAIVFATPPLGNAALVELVARHGWNHNLRNYMIEGDIVPGAVTLWQTKFRAGTSASPDGSLASATASAEVHGSTLLARLASGQTSGHVHASLGARPGVRRAATTLAVTADWCFCSGHGNGQRAHDSVLVDWADAG